MLPYIIVFIINLFLAEIADRSYKKKKNLAIICFLLIGIFFTVFVGLRDFGVGYDTNVYIEPYFHHAEEIDNIKDFFTIENVDRGFLLLAYIAHLFSSDPQALLIVVELFIMIFTLLGLYNFKSVYDIKLSTFFVFYWLILFFFSENFMRQYCAMSLLFYGFSLYLKEKKIVYIVLQVAAYFFHTSSLLFLIIPVYYYLSSLKNHKRFLYSIFAIVVLLILAFSYYYFLALFGSYGILAEAYADRYSELGVGSHNAGVQLGFWSLAQILLQLFLIYEYRVVNNETSKIKYLSTILLVTVLIFEQLNAYNVNLSRMALYFSQIYFIYFSIVFKISDTLKTAKVFLVLVMLRFCILSSFDHEYEPRDYTYSSKILGISKL